MFSTRLLGLARAHRAALVVVVGAGVAGGVLLVWQARELTRVIGGVFLGHETLAGVRGLLLLLALLALARAAVTLGGESAGQRLSADVLTGLRERLVARVFALGPAYARGERSGELVNTTVGGVQELDAYFSQYLPQLALAVLVPVIILAVVFPLDALSGLVLLLSAPLIPLFMALIGTLSTALTRRQWTSLSRMSAHFLDVLQGLTTLKLFGRSRRQAEVIARISDDFRRATMRVLRVAFLSALVLETVATISTAVVAVEVGLRLLYGTLSFERAFVVLLLAPEFYLPLRTLGLRYHAAMTGATASERIFAVLDTPPSAAASVPATAEPVPAAPARDLTLRFEHVRFQYAESARPALMDVTCTVPAGQCVALVGPSGAGKSTITDLLLRFIEPAGGTIWVNDVSLARLPANVWRERIAWVPQRPYLFHRSVAENIRLARPEATDEEVIAAARRAQAHDFILALPRGYDTLIGERGARLSGGQAQRIAIARAFLRDAPLLILDEATSQLDPEHEALIERAVRDLLRDRTVLVIAHRIATVTRADHIILLDEGQVAAEGTHETLLAGSALYRRLVRAYGTGAAA
jgi:ATP-binding cassette subfamily C protein CydD